MPPAVSFRDRLLAEMLRRMESDGAQPVDDAAAEEAAREAGGSFEERLAYRARQVAKNQGWEDAWEHLSRAAAIALTIGLLLGLVGGAAAARSTLGGGGSVPVNFFWVLLSLLGVQTLLLLGWLVVILVRPSSLGSGSLGGLVMSLGRQLSRWIDRGPKQAAATQTAFSVIGRSSVGTWSLSVVSHAIWLAFNIGCGVLIVVLLSTRHYSFGWETTILSKETYQPLTRAIGFLPEAAGFQVPTNQQIAESRWQGADADTAQAAELREAASEAWSSLLLGSVVLYGFGPRLLLLGLCLSLRRRARKRYRLDTSLPGFSRLQPRLYPARETLGVVDPEGDFLGSSTLTNKTQVAFDRPLSGPLAIVGFEIEIGEATWPPPVDGVDWIDLGTVDDRVGRDRVLQTLADSSPPPAMVVVICAVTTTPDRGVRRFLDDISKHAQSLGLLLTDGHRMRQRGDGQLLEQRMDDWRQLTESLGWPSNRLVEMDLEHATDHSLLRLRQLVGLEVVGLEDATAAGQQTEAADAVAAGLIRGGFNLIKQHASTWSVPPTVKEQTELHQAILELYRSQTSRWDGLWQTPTKLEPTQLAKQLRRGAENVVEILPKRLRLDPRWLGAGAVSGALGCLVAASMISPVAIGALPAWTLIGAALTTIRLKTRGADQDAAKAADATDGPSPDNEDAFDEAVRAAALNTVLLELQGLSETHITRVLDGVLSPELEKLITPRRVGDWLDETLHRLDVTLITVTGSLGPPDQGLAAGEHRS